MYDPSMPAEPDEIIDEMQKLDDIEADLADTALAIAAPEPYTPSGLDPVTDPSPTKTPNATLLQNAQVVERVLEQSIPDPPSIEQEDVPTPSQTGAHLNVQNATHTSMSPTPSQSSGPPDGQAQTQGSSSALISDVQDTLHVVQADLDNPILPPLVQEGESPDAEEELDLIGVADEDGGDDMQGLHDGQAASRILDTPLPPVDAIASLPPKPEVVKAVVPVAPPSPQLDIDLPPGLTTSSPSVSQNPGVVYAWSKEPSNPHTMLELFNWSAQRSEIEDARVWYNLLAKEEPTAIQPMLVMINLELALTHFSEVEALFAKALKGPSGGITAAADVSIWKSYLHYIRRQNPIAESPAESARDTINKAYEFALHECGTDRESGEIWQEYINFVAEAAPKTAWETQNQTDNLRKLYQRAVSMPLNNVEALWKAYDAFESSSNKATAKKFLAEKSPAYMTARGALRELRNLTDSLARPALPPHPTFSDADRRTVKSWKDYLAWEESNPLSIEDEDARAARMSYALRKCVGEMRHFPELWHYAAHYYAKNGKSEEAAEVLAAGLLACPSSMLLTFAVAEIEEGRNNLARCHEVFESLINCLNSEIDVLKKKIEVEVENAKGPEIPQPQGDDVDMTGDGMSQVQRLVEERENRGKLVAERRGKDVNDLAAAVGVVWVMYMRFTRRAEGSKSARGVFTKARKTPHPTWHIFEASAMMEYHANKDSGVAIRIFELGFKLFAEDVEYVVRYLQFLLSVNDDTNARALFERSAQKIPADRARPLWDAWARYEYMFGDLVGVHKLEARFAEVFPNDSPLKRFAQRFAYNGLDQIALRDLGFGSRVAPTPGAGLAAIPPPPMQPIQSVTSIQRPPSPAPPKRPLPQESPRPVRAPSPSYKRPRPQSPQGRRYTPPRADRMPSNPPHHMRDRNSRDRSPAAYSGRSMIPPVGYGSGGPGGYGPSPGTAGLGASNGYRVPSAGLPTQGRDVDSSGLVYPLARFIGNLPSDRYFDGPVFGPDDVMSMMRSVRPAGGGPATAPTPPPAPALPAGSYGPPGGGYAAPARGGYGDQRGYAPAPRRY